MRQLFRRAFLAIALTTGILGFCAVPARAINPMLLRPMMPMSRITPTMNGMTGRVGGMPMFNMQAGFVATPNFQNNFQRQLFHRERMMNRTTNAFNSGLGVGAMMGSSGTYPSMMSSYGGGGGGGGGYGQMTSVPSSAPSYESSTAEAVLALRNLEVSNVLTAAGLPNEGGQLNWPIGLQVLFPATENAQLLRQINAEPTDGRTAKKRRQVDAETLKGTIRATARLHEMFREREPHLQAPTSRDADRFLKNLENALKQLQASTAASSYK